MKNKLWLIAVVTAILFSFTACDDGTGGGGGIPGAATAYYGTWKESTSSPQTLVITNNEIKIDASDGDYVHFTITKWTAVENTNDSYKADYPNGYELEVTLTEIKGGWNPWTTVGETGTIPVFIHKEDGTKMVRIAVSGTPHEYTKQP